MNTAQDGPHANQGPPEVTHGRPEVTPREAVQRWRLVVARRAAADGSAQREELAGWEAALAHSRLPIAGLDGPRARPRFAIAAPLAASMAGEAELIDLWLVERLPVWQVREALESCVPDGIRLIDVHDVWLAEPALPGQVIGSVYRAELPALVGVEGVRPAALPKAVNELLAAPSLPRTRQKGDRVIAYDLRPFVDALEAGEERGGTVIRMTLLHDPEKGAGRPMEVLAALGDAMGIALEPTTLVRERLLLAQRSVPSDGSGHPHSPAGPLGRSRASARKPTKSLSA